MNRPELWVCRHGETEWSRDLKHTGTTDVALTDVGAQQAQTLAARLAGEQFDLVLASPRRRARDTAARAGFPDALEEPAAVEWDYGDSEGLTTETIRQTVPGWTVWTHPIPGGETAYDVGARADAVISRVRRLRSGRALLFTHGHLARVLAARWLGMKAAAGQHFRLDTGTVSVLGWERETPAIARWNA